MHPHVLKHFGTIIEAHAGQPARALDVGGRTAEKALLRFPSLAGAERVCLNLEKLESRDGMTAVCGNAHEMTMFADASFDLVLCNAMFEHDPFFWLSLAEMKRVLRPGGLLVIGVPGFRRNAKKDATPTPTHRYHMREDYYRFSSMAVRRVFFEGMRNVHVDVILDPPRMIGYGWKRRRPRPQQAARPRSAERAQNRR